MKFLLERWVGRGMVTKIQQAMEWGLQLQ